MTAPILTQHYLKSRLHYDPDTGAFTWRTSGPHRRAGNIAGSLDGRGYVQIYIDNAPYKAHRLAFLYMTGAMPTHCTDHINHVRYDNCWSNLREVTDHENRKNVPLRTTNKSGYHGVYWDKRRCKWRVKIGVNGKQLWGGTFASKQEAIARRKELEAEHGYHNNHGSETLRR